MKTKVRQLFNKLESNKDIKIEEEQNTLLEPIMKKISKVRDHNKSFAVTSNKSYVINPGDKTNRKSMSIVLEYLMIIDEFFICEVG